MSLISQFGEGVMKALWPLLEPKVDVFFKAFQDKAFALIPLAGATVVKLALEQAFDKIPGVEVPPLNVQDLADLARGDLNKIPDIDIPVLSDVFDLTEFLKGFGHH